MKFLCVVSAYSASLRFKRCSGFFYRRAAEDAETATETATGQSQIFLADWNEGEGKLGTPRQLTHVSTEADGAIWSPDSQRILFVSRVYPDCSEEIAWADEDACNKRKDDAAAKNPVKAMVFTSLLPARRT